MTTTATTLKFRPGTGEGHYQAVTDTGTYEVYKSHTIMSGIQRGGIYTSWKVSFTPAGSGQPQPVSGGGNDGRLFNTKREAVAVAHAHARGGFRAYTADGTEVTSGTRITYRHNDELHGTFVGAVWADDSQARIRVRVDGRVDIHGEPFDSIEDAWNWGLTVR